MGNRYNIGLFLLTGVLLLLSAGFNSAQACQELMSTPFHQFHKPHPELTVHELFVGANTHAEPTLHELFVGANTHAEPIVHELFAGANTHTEPTHHEPNPGPAVHEHFAGTKIHKTQTEAPDHEAQTDASDPYRSEFFRVRGAPSVTVHTLAGEIEVINNPSLSGVQIDLYVEQSFSFWSRSRSLDDYRIIIQQRGEQIVASVEDIRSGSRVYDPGSTRFTFLVQIPSDKATLNLRSMSGDISVDGFSGTHFIQNHAGNLHLQNLSGEVRASSTAGDIRILQSDGVLYANSISGSIFVDQAEGEIRLRTVSGDVDSRNVSGVLIAASTSGNIFSEFNKVSRGIHLETISGNVELVIPGKSGYTITAKGIGFDFQHLDLSDATQNIRSGNASVILHDGGIPVNITSLSGRIKIRDRR